MALENTLSSACPSRSRSPNIGTATPGVSSERLQLGLHRARAGRLDGVADHDLEVDVGGRMARPDSSIATSVSRSSTSRSSRSALRRITEGTADPGAAEVLEVTHQLAVADHRGQRGAQLVGDRGEELVLDAVVLLPASAAARRCRARPPRRAGPSSVSSGESDLDRELARRPCAARAGRRASPSAACAARRRSRCGRPCACRRSGRAPGSRPADRPARSARSRRAPPPGR